MFRKLEELLANKEITKVFCGAEGDLPHLGVPVTPVVDIESLASEAWGVKHQKRGLAQILSQASGTEWIKRSIKAQNWWRLKNEEQMIRCPTDFACYAAADAWATHQAHSYLCEGSTPRQLATHPGVNKPNDNSHAASDRTYAAAIGCSVKARFGRQIFSGRIRSI